MAASAYTTIDLLALAKDPSYFSTLAATSGTSPEISLLSYDPAFETSVLGPTARARKLHDLDWEAFHEGGVYSRETNSLYISSNFQSVQDNINITVLSLDDYSITSTQFPNLTQANGGSSYCPPDTGSNGASGGPPRQIWCSQGDFSDYSALVSVDVERNVSEVLVTNFLGRNFSSVNDVRQHPWTGDLWFTDADYGFYQDFRPAPSIPKQVYRFSPSTGEIQVVADRFDQPNGLEFSPDYQTLYISDTGGQHQAFNGTRPATIYAYDIVGDRFLRNRRVFAYADIGLPDGIHTDTKGNVWAGCGDGVHVWSSQGKLLGKIFVGETSNNFAFIPGGVVVFSNARLWIVENVKAQGRELCKDFGVGCVDERKQPNKFKRQHSGEDL